MQWDGGEHAGFSAGTPWMPVNPNHREINAEAQRDDPASVFSHYKKLIALRHELPVVAHGDFHMVLPNEERIYAFVRRLHDVELLVVGNFSSDTVTAELPESEEWSGSELVLSNYDDVTAAPSGRIALRPWEARVHRRAREVQTR